MSRKERKPAIMELPVTARSVGLEELAVRFSVSKMTSHRDLDNLEQAGIPRNIRGAGTVDAATQLESDLRIRARQDAEARARMARVAAKLVEPGMTVQGNDCSTSAPLSSTPVEKRPLTVIINSSAVLDGLRTEPGGPLMVLGGIDSDKNNAFSGVVTEGALSRLRADTAFISTPAIADCRGFHVDDAVGRTKRRMMIAAALSCLLINHKRFGRLALHVLAGLTAFDVIITDAAPAPEERAALGRADINLTIARDEA